MSWRAHQTFGIRFHDTIAEGVLEEVSSLSGERGAATLVLPDRFGRFPARTGSLRRPRNEEQKRV